eukprot:12849283-Ditylum_brightwellii.AAC.1
MATKLAYIMNRLVDKAYTAFCQMDLYKTPCIKFKGMLPKEQTYAMLKKDMLQAFKLWLQMGISGCPAGNVYYGAHTTTKDDSVVTITNSLNNIQRVNNMVACTINENMSAITHETQDIQNIAGQLQHQQTNYSAASFASPP